MEKLNAFFAALTDRFALLGHVLQNDSTLWLAVTLLCYALGLWIYKASGYKTIFTPLFLATIFLAVCILGTGTSYETYFKGGQYIHFLLGPATVALAVPLYEQRLRLAKLWFPFACGILAGATVAISSAVLIAGWFGASAQTLLSMAPKSVTVPIAVGISETLGGIPSLTTAFVIITGVTGSLICRPVFALLGEKNEARRGLAIGLTAHCLGTATAFQMSRDTGAFSGLSMALTGLLTAFAAPALMPWLMAILQ